MMRNKIPPPLLTFILMLIIFLLSKIIATHNFKLKLMTAVILLSIGVAIGIISMYQFKRLKTTLNPFDPNKTSILVTVGLYRYSRNPMYLANLFYISATTVYYFNYYSLIVPAFYVVYMTYFQIIPEEVILEKLFNESYLNYKKKVRRWL